MAHYDIRLASESDLSDIRNILRMRCEWFADNGLVGWKTNNYLRKYDDDYFKGQMRQNKLYVAVYDDDVCGLVLLKSSEETDYWADDSSAYYIHHLATDLRHKGVGKALLRHAEEVAKCDNKKYLRLDCYQESTFLNGYYQRAGFKKVGSGQSLTYKYNLWQKTI